MNVPALVLATVNAPYSKKLDAAELVQCLLDPTAAKAACGRSVIARVMTALGLPIIGKLLGHTQSATTRRYAHLDNDPLKKASEHIGGRLAAAMGEVKAPRANVTNISTVKRSDRREAFYEFD